MRFVIFVDALDYSIKNKGCFFYASDVFVVTKIGFGAGRLADIELQPVYEQESVYGHINLLPGKYVIVIFFYTYYYEWLWIVFSLLLGFFCIRYYDKMMSNRV